MAATVSLPQSTHSSLSSTVVDELSSLSLTSTRASLITPPAPVEERGRTGRASSVTRETSKIRSFVGAIGRAMSRDRVNEPREESRQGRSSSLTSPTTTPNRSLSRGRPPAAPSSVHSTQSTATVHFISGRGGFGNQQIRSPSRNREGIQEESEDETVVKAARVVEEERSRSRSRGREVLAPGGRGGRGNMRSASRQPTEKEAQKEREEIEKEKQIRQKMKEKAEKEDVVLNYGRGGAGNLKVRRGSES